jgi:hypothetical protein
VGGAMGLLGWGFQDFLKYFIGDENVFFYLQLFLKAPAQKPHRPTFIFYIIYVTFL